MTRRTTLAKLAAYLKIKRQADLGIISLDTYRIGAVEQLAAYARILNMPFEVASSPEEGDTLVRKHADKDLILIDTVGRSQRKRDHIAELGTFLHAAQPSQVHLVLSASADKVCRRESIESFGVLHADRIILTKLDECSQPGCVLELATSGVKPFSFVTNGQDVPDDIVFAQSELLAKFVWEGKL